MIREPQLKPEVRFFIFRDMVLKLIMEETEDTIIYAFISKDKKELINLSFSQKYEYLDMTKCDCYKVTLKNLYLYLMTIAHPNIPQQCLIIYANRILRRLSMKEAARLLSLPETQYLNIETGTTINIDLEKTAYMLNFRKDEFYINFKTIFEKMI